MAFRNLLKLLFVCLFISELIKDSVDGVNKGEVPFKQINFKPFLNDVEKEKLVYQVNEEDNTETTTTEDQETTEVTEAATKKTLEAPKIFNGVRSYTLSEALLIILMRTSLLYVYFVMTLYYVVLMEAEDIFSRLMSVLGKFMVVVTIATYIIAEYLLPTKEMYQIISRVAVLLFMISIIHLAVCIFRTFLFWRLFLEAGIYYCRRFTQNLGVNPRLGIIQDTAV